MSRTREQVVEHLTTAAALVESGEAHFCCIALRDSSNGQKDGQAERIFTKLFKRDALAHSPDRRGHPCKHAWMANASEDAVDARDIRVIALCLAASIVEAGDVDIYTGKLKEAEQ